jgi:hypothetical protein
MYAWLIKLEDSLDNLMISDKTPTSLQFLKIDRTTTITYH